LIFRLADIPLIVRPSLAGKWTTTLQVTTVGLVLLNKIWPISPLVLVAFFWFTGFLTAISGIQYLYNGIQMMNQAHGNGPQRDNHG